MESENELKEIDIKNCTCYYFDDTIRSCDRNIDFNNILLGKKLCRNNNENILIYDISLKTSTD